MQEIVNQKAEVIASKLREHFPHVHVMIHDEHVFDAKWYSGIDPVLTINPNEAHFIVSDIPYKRSDYPSHSAFLSVTDVTVDKTAEEWCDIIARMKVRYEAGSEAR